MCFGLRLLFIFIYFILLPKWKGSSTSKILNIELYVIFVCSFLFLFIYDPHMTNLNSLFFKNLFIGLVSVSGYGSSTVPNCCSLNWQRTNSVYCLEHWQSINKQQTTFDIITKSYRTKHCSIIRGRNKDLLQHRLHSYYWTQAHYGSRGRKE